MEQTQLATAAFITPSELKDHWQSHRSLTRKMIVAYPEDQLFTYSIGGMRTFGGLLHELIALVNGLKSVVGEPWEAVGELEHHKKEQLADTKEALLARWDEQTDLIESYWPRIPAERFHEVQQAFGVYEGPVYSIVLYWIDNEIHHRGQAYVYFRALGVTPPAFWDRY